MGTVKEKIILDFKNKGGLIKCSYQLLTLIREKFSVKNSNPKTRRIYQREYAITPLGAFQIGLGEEIENFIRSWTIPYELEKTKEYQNNFTPVLKGIKVSDIQNVGSFTYYDYQRGALEEFILHGRGIALLATSAGKSPIIGGMIKTILHKQPDAKILVIVPDIGLQTQLEKSFNEEFFIEPYTVWGDGKIPDLTQNVLIANIKMLIMDIKKSLSIVKDYDYLIMDEVHNLGEKKNKINKIVYNMTTPHKFGLTGTLSNKMMATWNVLGKIGPILIHESSYSIRKKGTAANVKIKVIVCRHKKQPEPVSLDDLGKPLAKYRKEIEFIQTSEERNGVIKNICSKLNGNVLVLIDNLNYGQRLFDLMGPVPDKQTFFINGEVETDVREDIKQIIEQNKNVICIAMSRIFSTGISIKNLKYVVFTYMGKANIRISQSIGRSMRLHDDKECAYIFDIADKLEYSFDHLKSRMRIYKDEKFEYEIKTIDI